MERAEWEAKHQELRANLLEAARALLQHSRAYAGIVPMGAEGVVAFGMVDEVRQMVKSYGNLRT